jgi:hypothetical protein
MTSKAHFAIAVLAALLVCSATQAQTHGGGAPAMPTRVAPIPVATGARGAARSTAPVTSGARASRQGTVMQIAPSGGVISNTGSFINSVDAGNENGVPGLGFDYVHLAAVSGNFRGNPPGFGHGEHHHRGSITPVLFGGYPYYSDSVDYQQEQQQPQVIVIQQPAPTVTIQQLSPQAQEPPSAEAEALPPALPPAPVREVGEFILVRRDGRVLFASVFSVTGAQVQYVTPEGIRRTLLLSDLDTVATQEMNEARGTTLQFHN